MKWRKSINVKYLVPMEAWNELSIVITWMEKNCDM